LTIPPGTAAAFGSSSITGASPSVSAAAKYVKAGALLHYFAGRRNVSTRLRAREFEVLQEAGVAARGIDLDRESVATCRAGLEAAPTFRISKPAGGLADGVFCSQVVEHLPPEQLPELVKLAAAAWARRRIGHRDAQPGVPGDLRDPFYLDPTHTRPVPTALASTWRSSGWGDQVQAVARDRVDARAGLCRRFGTRSSWAGLRHRRRKL
jgi:hypothetical protein